MSATDTDSGLYVLVIEVTRRVRIRALGGHDVEPGWYAYVGSARRNLRSRVARHLRRKKPIRWHVDHLTTHPAARVAGVVLLPDAGWSECALNRLVGTWIGGTVPVPGFGASDCREGCQAHLWRAERPVAAGDIAAALGGVTLSRA